MKFTEISRKCGIEVPDIRGKERSVLMGTALALVSIETRLLLCLRIATKKGVVSVLEVADRVAEEVDDGCDCDDVCQRVGLFLCRSVFHRRCSGDLLPEM